MKTDHTIKDSVSGGWVEHMPPSMRPYLRLSRYDRPIGFWLLGLPGWIGLAFAALHHGFAQSDLIYALLIAIGAIAMRGAGCTYNDIVDRDLDAKVERTALRPLPAGTITVKQAWIWLVLQCLVGLIVLAFFPRLSQIIALSALGLVAAYPFMKRITFWPQAWLGLTFNWAVLVAYTAKTGEITPALLILYAGLVLWTIGYDTIYACQDVEDDAMIGVKSTARLFGEKTRLWVGLIYGLCAVLMAMAISYEMPSSLPVLALVIAPFFAHFIWQIAKLDAKDGELCLTIFKSNRAAGLILIASLMLAKLL
ncbi:MAG TPA: 4-hydroxybenzoate octaprenyltransferase [Hellea balneolensis]|uniref:4-hydroxybenzoate octaprenyltransferase n=1 Tax=Hellea balneolensis TaxID=287478 RepID=A0A7C3G9M3_9PROT|nr:4-hydroxybenzoate octaprenyltransferase [Hellea balneolensis]